LFSTAFETAHHLLAAGCVLFAVFVPLQHRVERAAGALALCVLCAGALLTLHGHVALGASIAVLLMASTLFLLFVQLTVDVGEVRSGRRFSVRGVFAGAVVAFFGAAVVGNWSPSFQAATPPSTSSPAAKADWAQALFTTAHVEVALLCGMGLISLLLVFLLIRRQP